MDSICEYEYLNNVLNLIKEKNSGLYEKLLSGVNSNKMNELALCMEKIAQRKRDKSIN
jgi:hypothetical protein